MFEKLICRIVGHNHYIIKEVITGFSKVGCKRCKQEWLKGDKPKSWVPWNNYIEESSKQIELNKNTMSDVVEELINIKNTMIDSVRYTPIHVEDDDVEENLPEILRDLDEQERKLDEEDDEKETFQEEEMLKYG